MLETQAHLNQHAEKQSFTPTTTQYIYVHLCALLLGTTAQPLKYPRPWLFRTSYALHHYCLPCSRYCPESCSASCSKAFIRAPPSPTLGPGGSLNTKYLSHNRLKQVNHCSFTAEYLATHLSNIGNSRNSGNSIKHITQCPMHFTTTTNLHDEGSPFLRNFDCIWASYMLFWRSFPAVSITTSQNLHVTKSSENIPNIKRKCSGLLTALVRYSGVSYSPVYVSKWQLWC